MTVYEIKGKISHKNTPHSQSTSPTQCNRLHLKSKSADTLMAGNKGKMYNPEKI